MATPETPTELPPEELEAQQAAELPTREALSLIDPSSSLFSGYPTPLDGVSTTDDTMASGLPTTDSSTGTADSVAGDASGVPGSTAAAASGSESETPSVTDTDRSEQISQSDSAFAGPS